MKIILAFLLFVALSQSSALFMTNLTLGEEQHGYFHLVIASLDLRVFLGAARRACCVSFTR